jgi:hypothetical protein
MNIIVKSKNLINLKNSIDIDNDNYIYFYKGKSIKFLDEGIYLIYFILHLDELNEDTNVILLKNHNEMCTLKKINNQTYLLSKIIKLDNQDILSFKNKTNIKIKIHTIKLNIYKI